MPKVLIAPATLDGVAGPYRDTLLSAGFDLVYPGTKTQLTESQLLEFLRGAEASLAGSEPYTPRVLQAHPQLKVIARAGVGYDAVDLQAATEQGVAVTFTPNTNQNAVAEHTFTLILALAKSLLAQHQGTIQGKWPRRPNLPVRGRTLGIAGLGRIGKAVALRGECFGMKLLAYEPYPDHDFAQAHGLEFVAWEDLLARADFLTLHMPATPQARHIINRQSLARMKPGAFLINTARGALVNEPDLVEALQARKIAGAGIDVFEEEPPGDHPLFHLDNVVITPHAAGVDLQSLSDMTHSAAQAIVSLKKGEWCAEKVVNPEVRGKFKW